MATMRFAIKSLIKMNYYHCPPGGLSPLPEFLD